MNQINDRCENYTLITGASEGIGKGVDKNCG